MPKLVIAATGDQFFLPDDSHFFWDDLPEPKYLKYDSSHIHAFLFHSNSSTLRHVRCP